MLLARRELEACAARWEASVQARLHAEAELALCDPGDATRRRLIEQCHEHPSWRDKYEDQLKHLVRLRDHEYCRTPAEDGTYPDDTHLALALDCEMIETTGDDMALARVSVVNVQGRTVLDIFVLPCEPTYIVDCRTSITGLDKQDLIDKGVTRREAQRRFAGLCCADTVLLGHALDHDLLALGLRHDLVVDTSFLFPVLDISLTGPTYDRLHSLNHLSETVLRRSMDRSSRGGIHDSIEDSVNSLDLVKYLVCAYVRNAAREAPPVPAKARQFRQRGPNYGFAEALRARQVFASASEATTSWAKGEARKARVREFYSLQLVSSFHNHDIVQTTILKVSASTPAPSRPAPQSSTASTAPSSASSSSSQHSSRPAPPTSSRVGTAQILTRVPGRANEGARVSVAQTDLHRALAGDRERIRRKNEAKARVAKLMGKAKHQRTTLFGRRR